MHVDIFCHVYEDFPKDFVESVLVSACSSAHSLAVNNRSEKFS